jgi:hypothetical protein
MHNRNNRHYSVAVCVRLCVQFCGAFAVSNSANAFAKAIFICLLSFACCYCDTGTDL